MTDKQRALSILAGVLFAIQLVIGITSVYECLSIPISNLNDEPNTQYIENYSPIKR